MTSELHATLTHWLEHGTNAQKLHARHRLDTLVKSNEKIDPPRPAPLPITRSSAPNGDITKVDRSDDPCTAQRTIDPYTIITAEKLMHDTLEMASCLSSDIDAVVAVARSGLICGSLLAAWLHTPLYAVSRVHGVVDPGHGFRMGTDFAPYGTEPEHVLIIDDTAANGFEMPACTDRVKARFPAARITKCVIYCAPQAAKQVDVYHSLYAGSHYLAWNWPNAGHGEAMVFDFDGILCQDCPPGDDDDGPRYRRFLETARPLYLPRRRSVPVIVSARHERYRDLCLTWLAKHRVKPEKLVLRDWDYDPARSLDEQVGPWKADIFRKTDCTIFAESSPTQAEIINRITGRHVFCPALGRVLPPIVFISNQPQYPSFARQAWNASKAAAQVVAAAAQGHKVLVDPQEQDRRLAICKEPCEFYDAAHKRCRKCGCYTNLKARIASSHCPINKW